MLTAEQILNDVRRWGVELEVTSRAECPLCLRVRFPDEMPSGLRKLVSRAIARRKFEIATLLAREGDEGVDGDARTGRAETREGRPETRDGS